MTLWDHIFFVVVLFAIPLYTWRSYAPWAAKVEALGEPVRIAGYRETIGLWLGSAIALVALWFTTGRDWSDLGLSFSATPRFFLGALLGLGLVVLVWWQLRLMVSKVLGGRVTRERLREQFGTLEAMMPSTQREIAWFQVVAINAGVTEELIWRGFLLWYLEPFVGLPLAAVLSAVLFSLAHSYQGLKQLPGIAVMAGLMVALYLVSGTIWVPMVIHAAVDLVQGNLLVAHLRTQGLVAQD